jgi:hypothetical protein
MFPTIIVVFKSMIYLPKIWQKIFLISVKKQFFDHTLTKKLFFKENFGKYYKF